MAIPPQEQLIEGLMDAAAYPHPVQSVRHLETHISHVLLTGEYAYKIKKPVDFGFVNYTTLERRRHFCEEELRLNRRLAPELYLDVVPVTRREGRFRIGGADEPLEYAVRMREFPQSAQMDRMLAAGRVRPEHIDRLADLLSRFHGKAPAAGEDEPYGGPEQVAAAVRANFELTAPFVPKWIGRAQYDHVRAWSESFLGTHREVISARRRDGFVRDCHGDAHLQNIALVDGELILFDCIEFNPAFRIIDVMAEAAFTCMDLDFRGRTDLAARFLNGYLERSGDYEGLAVLPLYLSYRAYVRAKVAALSPDAARRVEEIRRLVALSDGYTRSRNPALILMHGVTGSGKTVLSQGLLERLGAVRVRSDAERKRLAGAGRARRAAAVGEGIYDAASTERTYNRLHELAGRVLAAGFPVILDATYLRREFRRSARQVAEALQVPFVVVETGASRDELARRVAARRAAGGDLSDATLEVLEAQLRAREPLTPAERACAISIDTETGEPEGAVEAVRNRLSALSPGTISG